MDEFALQRFVDAQDDRRSYDQALAELRGGKKTTHWIWYVFPQVAGLGQSPTSRHFAISGLEEARAFLAHPLLGSRLRAAAAAVAAIDDRSVEDVMGALDAQKLRSSMTLFMRASPDETVFADVLDKCFDGVPDAATDRLLP